MTQNVWDINPVNLSPPTPVEAPLSNLNPAPAVVQPDEFVGLPVRQGGDKIFLLKNGKKHWVSSAEVYTKLGFKFGDERKIDALTLALIPEGEVLR